MRNYYCKQGSLQGSEGIQCNGRVARPTHTIQPEREIQNSFQGVKLNVGRPFDRVLNQLGAFRELGEEHGGQNVLSRRTGGGQYRIQPVDRGCAIVAAGRGSTVWKRTEIGSLCQRFGIDSPLTVIQTYRQYRDSNGNDKEDGQHHPHPLCSDRHDFQCRMRAWIFSNESDLHLNPRLSAYLHHITATLSEPCRPTPDQIQPSTLCEVMDC